MRENRIRVGLAIIVGTKNLLLLLLRTGTTLLACLLTCLLGFEWSVFLPPGGFHLFHFVGSAGGWVSG